AQAKECEREAVPRRRVAGVAVVHGRRRRRGRNRGGRRAAGGDPPANRGPPGLERQTTPEPPVGQPGHPHTPHPGGGAQAWGARGSASRRWDSAFSLPSVTRTGRSRLIGCGAAALVLAAAACSSGNGGAARATVQPGAASVPAVRSFSNGGITGAPGTTAARK